MKESELYLERHMHLESLRKLPFTENPLGIPDMPGCDIVPDKLVSIDHIGPNDPRDAFVHSFSDDCKIDSKLWTHLRENLPRLAQRQGVASPDFTIPADAPLWLVAHSVGRARTVANELAWAGIPVLPTAVWGKPDTFNLCFAGLPKRSNILVSTRGVWNSTAARIDFAAGFCELIKRAQPKRILIFGKIPDFVELGRIEIVHYLVRNHTQIVERAS